MNIKTIKILQKATKHTAIRYGACLEDRKMSKNNIEVISDFCIFDKK